jgi:hypothetical protein
LWSASIACKSFRQASISAGVAGRFRMRRNSSSISLASSVPRATSPGQVIARVGDGVAEGRAADQGHDGAELQAAGALALAGALAGRAAEGDRKPLGSSTPESGSAAARVPGGTPGNFDDEPVAR